ncbi:efflux RND transporter periplasmic adaptor subunit [Pseudodesulfovibrio sp. zrk46]|uniref:efflux RND transporter periplasmic adaptor subunit n=1 Tax=Pseudodesulfovibrio sp. zrk46 TaxID=2725288 RepID=UPI00144A272E|nr:efflux RND transporter periplasmic adaptor subunit [Pseudodesulfovibrio sp. zrk46]QJB57145.1 efflux RND transporter periplasmic adaptor subunit [Pseudodesulfovibrio sp. zrk46]
MKVMKAAKKDMPYWGEFVGTISAVESVDVRARVAGFLLEKRFDEGRKVNKGDLLFVIDPKSFQEDLNQAESGLEYNQALLAKAKKDYERFKKLYDDGVVSREEFESYQTSLATYKAQVRDNAAQVENARIQLGYTKIYSPIDGIIGRVKVDLGNLVGQGENTLLATVSTVDPVYVSFSIPESDYIRARRNPEMQETREKEIELILADGSKYDVNGSFSMIDRAVDPQTGTLGIRVSFPNPDGLLRPGQYGKVRVLIESLKDAVVVPTRGVQDTQGMKSIYKVGDDGKVVNQPIKIGFEADNMVVVTEGLNAGDTVIIDGIRRVRPGMEIKPIVVPMDTPQNEAASMGNPQDTEQKEN